jgi:hypothetical protein
MANPFVAGADPDPTAGLPDSDTFSKLQDQWNTFLAKPEGQAALLSFGINMLQPPSFGDNPLAQAGRAIGHAGETVGNIEKMDIAQREAASKEDERASRAQLAESKAAHAGDVSTLGTERNRLLLENTQAKLELGRLSANMTLQGRYDKDKMAYDRDVMHPPPGSPGYVPFPSYSEWLVSSPETRELAAKAGITVSIAPGVMAKPTTGLSPADQQALDWANANPGDPRAAQIHTRLGR